MSTEAQIESNRKNSEKSSGPRTAQGKDRASRNSTIHGLTGNSPVLPGEDPAGLQSLIAQYRDDLHPIGQAESDLVERMAIATYRLRRLVSIETGLFDLHLRQEPVPHRLNQDGLANPLSWAFLNDQTGTLDRLGRYESRIQRDYARCLAALQKLQAIRKKEIGETNPKSKVNPSAPTRSADSELPDLAFSASQPTAASPPLPENDVHPL
ncbi:MAG: hypothetical protein ABSF54_05635 [Bryobacteraceae bacterium]|jgi:hypothetical protein